MHRIDTQWHWWEDEQRFGEVVFHAAMPNAIRSLKNNELQTLLVALLQEWRNRTGAADERENI